MLRTKTGAYLYKNSHRFTPFRSATNKKIWMVLSFKLLKMDSPDAPLVGHHSVVALNEREAVKEAIAQYERNKHYTKQTNVDERSYPDSRPTSP